MEYPFLTGLGLAAPAGLNAYIPLLIVALLDRFTSQIDLDSPFDFLGSTWGIVILTLLVTVEIIVDKIPGIDHLNDLIQSVVRPAAGAFLMMAANSDGGSLNPVGAMFIGLVVAGGVHAGKALSRPAVTVTTGGLGNPIVSIAEDGLAALTAIIAVLVPLLVPLFIMLILLAIALGMRHATRLRRRVSVQSLQPSVPTGPSSTLRR